VVIALALAASSRVADNLILLTAGGGADR